MSSSNLRLVGNGDSLPTSRWRKAVNIFGRIEDAFLAVTSVLLLGTVAAQIVSRYILNISLSWPDEVSRILLVWLTFIGTAAVMKRRGHMGLEFLAEKVGQRRGHLVDAVLSTFVVAFALVVIWSGWLMTLQGAERLSPALHIPFTVVYASIPIGALIVSIRAGFGVVEHVRSFIDAEYAARYEANRFDAESVLDFIE